MAPKVQVPMDFGVKYLGSPSHSNLKFRLESGEEILANSVIISYNSPVIDSLTTDLFQTTIDVDDFAKEAVQCFVEASYSGELEKVSKSNFRDVNKMAHVFEVSWIVERCFGYFMSLTEEVKEDNYEAQLYVFEEAMFMLTTLKKRSFVDVVIESFSTLIDCSHFFLTSYVHDLSLLSIKYLDVVIEIAGNKKHILMEIIICHLEKNKDCLDSNSRYLLENVNFTACFTVDKLMYQQLLEKLEGIQSPSKEDFNLMLKLFKQSNQRMSELQLLKRYVQLPNLFHSFEIINKFSSFDALVDFLIESPLVTSSYMFYEAVYCWLFDRTIDVNNCPVTIGENFIEKFASGMTKKGWKPLAKEYVKDKVGIKWLGGLADKIIKSQKLTTDGYYRIASVSEYTAGELFLNHHDIKFHFQRPATGSCCNKAGNCGLILRVTPATDGVKDLFDIKLVVDPELYPSDVHFHDDFQWMDMHFALVINQFKCYPVTWYGKPHRDESKQYWMWGAIRFFEKSDDFRLPIIEQYRAYRYLSKTAKIKPVLYLHDRLCT